MPRPILLLIVNGALMPLLRPILLFIVNSALIPSPGKMCPTVIDKSQPIESMGLGLRDHTRIFDFGVRARSNSRKTLPGEGIPLHYYKITSLQYLLPLNTSMPILICLKYLLLLIYL